MLYMYIPYILYIILDLVDMSISNNTRKQWHASESNRLENRDNNPSSIDLQKYVCVLGLHCTCTCIACFVLFITARSTYASAVLEIVILSVRLSACPSVCLLCDERKEPTADILISYAKELIYNRFKKFRISYCAADNYLCRLIFARCWTYSHCIVYIFFFFRFFLGYRFWQWDKVIYKA